MDITAAEPDTLKSDATHDHGTCTNEAEFVPRAGVEDLNVETVTSNRFSQPIGNGLSDSEPTEPSRSCSA